MDITPEELARLKALCDAADDAPWHIGHINEDYPSRIDIDDVNGVYVAENVCDNNSKFIIAARTALPLLITELENLKAPLLPTQVSHYHVLREENARLREALDKHRNCYEALKL